MLLISVIVPLISRLINDSATMSNTEEQAELREMYDSMIPAFNEAYPTVFDLNVFSFELFAWADTILNHYSIENPLAIVPL